MKTVTAFTCLFFLLACSEASDPPLPKDPPETVSARLTTWLDEQFAEYLDFSPLAKTRLGDKSDYDKLDDVSDAMADKRLEWRKASVASMRSLFDRTELDDESGRSFDLWIFMLERAEDAVAYRRHGYVFGRRGPHTGLPNSLINFHRVDEVADMQAYIARLEATGRYLRQYLERAKASAAMGIHAPYFDYEMAINQIGRVTTGHPFTSDGTSALWGDITSKIESLQDSGKIDAAQAETLADAARLAIRENMQPAYDDILSWLEADQDNVSEEAAGAWALPDGKAYYDYALERMTTLPLSALEIHETGLSEVARIHGEMETIVEAVGYGGTLQEFFDHLRESDEFYFPDTDEGREAYLDLARDYLTRMEAKLPEHFGILPAGPLEVRRVEPFREQAGGAAHYVRGTRDGSRPGVFYAHLADMRAVAKYRLENLAYHEGVPGHHLQIAIQTELRGIPKFRTYHGYTAFSEGWGLYSEYLGKEMGFYQDPYSDFGRLTGELWRAIRLVVDTGIHSMHWSERQAIDYARLNSPRPEAAVVAEIRRYFNMPAQATAYKIGMLKIQSLRDEAARALGTAFNIRKFHDVVLGSGPLSLSMLEAKVEAWVAAEGG